MGNANKVDYLPYFFISFCTGFIYWSMTIFIKLYLVGAGLTSVLYEQSLYETKKSCPTIGNPIGQASLYEERSDE